MWIVFPVRSGLAAARGLAVPRRRLPVPLLCRAPPRAAAFRAVPRSVVGWPGLAPRVPAASRARPRAATSPLRAVDHLLRCPPRVAAAAPRRLRRRAVSWSTAWPRPCPPPRSSSGRARRPLRVGPPFAVPGYRAAPRCPGFLSRRRPGGPARLRVSMEVWSPPRPPVVSPCRRPPSSLALSGAVPGPVAGPGSGSGFRSGASAAPSRRPALWPGPSQRLASRPESGYTVHPCHSSAPSASFPACPSGPSTAHPSAAAHPGIPEVLLRDGRRSAASVPLPGRSCDGRRPDGASAALPRRAGPPGRPAPLTRGEPTPRAPLAATARPRSRRRTPPPGRRTVAAGSPGCPGSPART